MQCDKDFHFVVFIRGGDCLDCRVGGRNVEKLIQCKFGRPNRIGNWSNLGAEEKEG